MFEWLYGIIFRLLAISPGYMSSVLFKAFMTYGKRYSIPTNDLIGFTGSHRMDVFDDTIITVV